MKKAVLILFIITIFSVFYSNNKYVIPNEAIRFRIIANSNNIDDQLSKNIIKQEVEEELKNILKSAESYEEANIILNSNLAKIENIIGKKTKDYQISYGLNYFPEKEYKNVSYPEGEYNSLVITLGSGLGNNWWCVLYPPLCFVDESNIEDNEYSFFIKEFFSKYN